jgi:hypothetical protein
MGNCVVDDEGFVWINEVRGCRVWSYVFDSKNFALRVIDIASRTVRPVAGNGAPGYAGDGADARSATFGSDPTAPRSRYESQRAGS